LNRDNRAISKLAFVPIDNLLHELDSHACRDIWKSYEATMFNLVGKYQLAEIGVNRYQNTTLGPGPVEQRLIARIRPKLARF
jgi:hypothetical protein